MYLVVSVVRFYKISNQIIKLSSDKTKKRENVYRGFGRKIS